MNALEKWASDEFRSINGQLEWIITNALNNAGRKIASSDDKEKNDTRDE